MYRYHVHQLPHSRQEICYNEGRYTPAVTYDELRDSLIKVRKEHGWSMPQVARRVGVSRQVINNWEKGHSRADYEQLAMWAEAVGRRLSIAIPPKEAPTLMSEVEGALAGLSDEEQGIVIRFAHLLQRTTGLAKRMLLSYVRETERELTEHHEQGQNA